MKITVLLIFQLVSSLIVSSSSGKLSMFDDLLNPYSKTFGSKHSIRAIRSIQSSKFENSTYEIWKSHNSTSVFPVSITRYFSSDVTENVFNKIHFYGHFTQITNPLETFSVYETALSSCEKNTTASAVHGAKIRNCLVAQNGGFFNTKTGACIGNIVSNGHHVHDDKGIQNAHFGITKNGMIMTGYFSQEDIARLNFFQLIGGVIWLVRNGSSFVEEAIQLEEESSEETGTLRKFVDVISARTAIGHDREGRIIFVQVDGQTGARGINLKSFSKFLIEQLHVVNAINLDGGGSATLVLNGSLANYPSDHCADDPMFRCPRPISTVICAHEPFCNPSCKSGSCVMGRCECDSHWRGDTCDVLQCGDTNCSQHGFCTPAGCSCDPGWKGVECQLQCDPGWHGANCSQRCVCVEGSSCDPVSGRCECGFGFTGRTCDQECPVGTFGKDCKFICNCNESCLCDRETGVCLANNETFYEQPLYNVSQCLARDLQKRLDLNLEHTSTFQLIYLIYIALVISVALNLFFSWKICFGSNCRRHRISCDENRFSDDSMTSTIVSKPSRFKLLIPSRWSSKIQYTRLVSEPETLELQKLIES